MRTRTKRVVVFELQLESTLIVGCSVCATILMRTRTVLGKALSCIMSHASPEDLRFISR